MYVRRCDVWFYRTWTYIETYDDIDHYHADLYSWRIVSNVWAGEFFLSVLIVHTLCRIIFVPLCTIYQTLFVPSFGHYSQWPHNWGSFCLNRLKRFSNGPFTSFNMGTRMRFSHVFCCMHKNDNTPTYQLLQIGTTHITPNKNKQHTNDQQ